MSDELFVGLYLGALLLIAIAVTVLTRGSALRDVEMRFSSPLRPAELRDEALGDFLRLMAAEEFALADVDGGRLHFLRYDRPRWTFYVATFFWPLGLLALLRRRWIATSVTVEETAQGSAIVAEGTMTLRLQRALRTFFAPPDSAPDRVV
ncbi:MAG: hypothetical protein M3320_08195 [Actinomycetota bacterium]|nr:hypothetical protein [Actinomycetota bacterium]MDQ5808640.1 hypothetical protein [Actinomycetota bacterium]